MGLSYASETLSFDYSLRPWIELGEAQTQDRVRERLGQLSGRLGDTDWLDGTFSAGDLMMVSVLLRPKSSGILDEYPNLATYVSRGETGPPTSGLSKLN